YGYSMTEMMNILNKKSGVLGISGVSSDFRDLDAAAAEGNQRAKLAIDVFTYSVKKYIGSYAAAMGGVDAIVFTAGVGENSPALRVAMTSGLEYMGVAPLNAEANQKRGDEVDVSGEGSKVKVLVIPTNEELMIAMDTAEIVKAL
ncbi:MAG: acetate kinase, partial [Clostridiales bacterium]|nr:acetate kinase [Clostridiales bacterium]